MCCAKLFFDTREWCSGCRLTCGCDYHERLHRAGRGADEWPDAAARLRDLADQQFRCAVQATADALEAVYRRIDTATMYRNETGIGKALASAAPAGIGVRHDQAPRTMPVGSVGRWADSLSKLGLDYVDLWLVHWPPNGPATAA